METNSLNTNTPSKTAKITGWVISVICILFLLFDAICKIVKEVHSVSGSAPLGLQEHTLPTVGIVLLICTIVYAIPRTAIIGAILLTGYLGGAIAIMLRVDMQVYFATVFGILVWLGLYLRNPKVKLLLR